MRAYLEEDLPRLSPEHRQAIGKCQGGLGTGLRTCLSGLPASFPADARRRLRAFSRELQVANLVVDLCDANPGAVCPSREEFRRELGQFLAAAQAPSVAAGVETGDEGGLPITGVADAKSSGSSDGEPSQGGPTSGRHALTLGPLMGTELFALDRVQGTARFEPALGEPPVRCPFISRGGCGASEGESAGERSLVDVTGAQQAVDRLLIVEAARYLVRAEAIAYVRQAALVDPLTAEGFDKRVRALVSSCPLDSPLRGDISEIGSGASVAFASSGDAPDRARRAHHAGAIEAAARLAALDRQNAVFRSDFEQLPDGLDRRWPAWLPGRTAAQLIDASTLGVRYATQAHPPCSTFKIGFYGSALVGEEQASPLESEADRWLEREGMLRSSSRATDRCRIKGALLEANAQSMAGLLAQYPELGEQVGGSPLFRVLDALPVEMREARLQKELNFGTSSVLKRMRDSVGRLCGDPENAGRALFADDSFLRNFLSCGGSAPLPVDAGSASEMRLGAGCREIRANAGAACSIRDEARKSELRTDAFMGTLGVGIDIVGTYAGGVGVLRGMVARNLFASAGRSISANAPGAAAGAASGAAVVYYQIANADRTGADATGLYYSGLQDLQGYAGALSEASEARRNAFRDVLLGVVLGHVGSKPLLRGELKTSYLRAVSDTGRAGAAARSAFGSLMKEEFARRFGMRASDLARLTDEDVVAIVRANGALAPDPSLGPIPTLVSACKGDAVCQKKALDHHLFESELAETLPAPGSEAPSNSLLAEAPTQVVADTLPASSAGGGGGLLSPITLVSDSVAVTPPTVRQSFPPTRPQGPRAKGRVESDAAPEYVTISVSDCCAHVASGTTPRLPIMKAGGKFDAYYAGEGIAAPVDVSDVYSYSPPSMLRGSPVKLGYFGVPNDPVEVRLVRALSSGKSTRLNTTFVGAGSQSTVYFNHGPIPLEILAAIEAAPDEASAAAVRRTWAEDAAVEVIKIRTGDPWARGLEAAAYFMRRDLALVGLADQLTEAAMYLGRRFIRPARITSTNTQHVQGVITQEAVRGIDVNQLQTAIDRLVFSTSKHPELKMSAEEARSIIARSGLTIDEARSRIAALEEFYRQTHQDVIYFQQANGFSQDLMPHNEIRSRAIAPVGFDYGHGRNVIWSPAERMFIMIDL